MKIHSLPCKDRPREKLAQLGVGNLTNPELLALILGSGNSKNNVLSLSKLLLKQYSLENLKNTTLAQLKKIRGIGPAQAGKIVATLELGKRIFAETNSLRINSAQDIDRLCTDIKNKNQEYLLLFCLNAQRELLAKEIVAVGQMNRSLIEAAAVFRPALTQPAAFIILAHNHPSGNTAPSDQDLQFTKKIIELGKILGVTLLDHIIVTHDNFSSVLEYLPTR